MNRQISVLLILGVAIAVLPAAQATPERELGPAEMSALIGGSVHPQFCCGPEPACQQLAKTCNGVPVPGDWMSCMPRSEVRLNHTLNLNDCNTVGNQGDSCTKSVNTHPCVQEFHCMWDCQNSVCNPDVTPFKVTRVTNSCTDNCP